jgi:5-methylthioadenosine/S-adenosylhomocysteine deaminase
MAVWLRNLRPVVPTPGQVGWPALIDLLVDDGVVRAAEPSPARHGLGQGEELDLAGALVVPGLVNAHAHNHELYLKGTAWGLPLEPYILANSPTAPSGAGLDDEALYDRTLLSAREMLRNGITTVADDVIHPRMTRPAVEAVLQAYADSGIRARVSLMVEDAPWRRSIPLAGAPTPYDETLDTPPHDPEASLALYKSLLADWPASSGVSLMVSPSAPQRCTPEFLRQLVNLAREHGVPFHVHVQETLTQRSHGPNLFAGRTMIRFLHDNGLLGPETMIAHAIWLDATEIAMIADAGSTVVHNPVSNAKLGSGVAPVRQLLSAGVPVALGTDGLTCNDALDLFEVMKMAALLSNLASTDPADWLTPAEVLTAATAGGAAVQGTGRGGIEPGAPADLVFLDPQSYAFTPENDAVAQTVFSARCRDVLHVMVDGRFVVRDRDLAARSRPDLRDSVTQAARRFWGDARSSLDDNRRLMPYVEAAYRQAVKAAQAPGAGPYRLVPPFSCPNEDEEQ